MIGRRFLPQKVRGMADMFALVCKKLDDAETDYNFARPFTSISRTTASSPPVGRRTRAVRQTDDCALANESAQKRRRMCWPVRCRAVEVVPNLAAVAIEATKPEEGA